MTIPEVRLAPGMPVTPERAGWRYLSFRVETLAGPAILGAAERETALVILSGGGLRIGEREVPGRTSVWERRASAAYLPAGCRVEVAPLGPSVELAIAEATAEPIGNEPVLIGPKEVTVEVRGAGNATREVHHIITPHFPAHRLEVVEVYTPSGNWSSWPPHKHDTDDMPREAILEEIYAYRFRRPQAWGIQRLYGGSVDGLWAVRDGETVIVRDGYHPFAATHGDDAYYLNALAGDRRTMACSYDPLLDGVREAWEGMARDPRVPLVP